MVTIYIIYLNLNKNLKILVKQPKMDLNSEINTE
jgi:hypothetical protein